MPEDRKPLLANLKLQKGFDQEVVFMLRRADADIDKMLKRLARKHGVGTVVRREQLLLVKRELLRELSTVYTRLGLRLAAAQREAAAEAIKVMTSYEQVLLGSRLSAAEVATLRESAVLTAQASVASATNRMMLTRLPLSKRVYRSQALVSGQVDRLVSSSLARGLNWREFAKEAKQFISPNTKGGVDYAAKRLARTEINNAFHATSVLHAVESPFVETVQWHLSGSHPRPDECNRFAEVVNFKGGQPGEWKPGAVPGKPHPQCLCFTTPEVMAEEDFIKGFEAGKFDAYLAKHGAA